MAIQQPQSINEVLAKLKGLIDQYSEEQNPLGYFAALYYNVTYQIAQAIAKGTVFIHNHQLEQLDIVFAQRYFDAMDAFSNGGTATPPWQTIFTVIRSEKKLALDQYVIPSAIVHIHFDLCLAINDTIRTEDLPAFEADFYALNNTITGLVIPFNNAVGNIWKPFHLLLKLFGHEIVTLEDAVLVISRKQSWKKTIQLAQASTHQQMDLILALENDTILMEKKLLSPSWLLSIFFKWVAATENGSVADKIKNILNK
jgi:hypothetical protein